MQGDLLSLWSPTHRAVRRRSSRCGSYWRLLAISIAMAFWVALAAVAMAYPIAYFLVFRAGRAAGFCLVLLLIPFWTSFLLRVMSWKFLLGSEGAINSAARLCRTLSRSRLSGMLYSRSAVVVTLVYVWIPFAALPISAGSAAHRARAARGRLPTSARRRGVASGRITFPLSLPGVLAAFFMVFIPTVGEYVTPLLIGGSSGSMYGNIIQDFFTKAANWPRGAALSMIMLAATAADQEWRDVLTHRQG